jgi:hypothetical protein
MDPLTIEIESRARSEGEGKYDFDQLASVAPPNLLRHDRDAPLPPLEHNRTLLKCPPDLELAHGRCECSAFCGIGRQFMERECQRLARPLIQRPRSRCADRPRDVRMHFGLDELT